MTRDIPTDKEIAEFLEGYALVATWNGDVREISESVVKELIQMLKKEV